MTATRTEAAEVPWERCSKRGCTGARGPDGACLAHLRRRELTTALAAIGRGRPLDARGINIDEVFLRRLLEACPKDAGGSPVVSRARFDRVTFAGEAGFAAVVFAHEVSFDGATFETGACFEGARFDGHARFARAHFTGPARFDDARFAGQAWFGGARFAAMASFDRSQFANLAWFGRARFATDASFEAAVFHGDTTFDGVDFGCHALFAGTVFEGETTFKGARFTHDGDFAGAAFTGKGGAPQAAARQAIWSGAALAPWGKRAAAAAVDYGTAAGIVTAGAAVGGLFELLQYNGALPVCLAAAVLCAGVFAVRNLLRQGHTGQTVGKARTGLCLVRERDGLPVGPALSLGRQLVHLVDCLPFLVGWLRPLWHAKRQTFADTLLTTVVVTGRGWARAGSTAEPEREAKPPPGGG